MRKLKISPIISDYEKFEENSISKIINEKCILYCRKRIIYLVFNVYLPTLNLFEN